MQYYAIDWIAMAMSLYSMYLIGQRNRSGFVLFMVSNLLWVYVGFLSNSMGILVGNVAFFLINLNGYLRWTKTQPKTPDPKAIKA